MYNKMNLFVSLLLITSSGIAQNTHKDRLSNNTAATHEFKYTNPITRDTSLSMRDYCIIKVDDKWYCTGTSNPIWTGPNPGVRMLVSDDLIHWKQSGWLIDVRNCLQIVLTMGGFGRRKFIS